MEKTTTHFLPCLGAVGLSGTIHSTLVFPEMHQGYGKTSKVGHVVVQQLGSLVHFVVETTICNLTTMKSNRASELAAAN